MQYFNLTVTPCPPGHAVYSTDEENEYECQCDDDNDENIISCLPEQSSIVLMVCMHTHSYIRMCVTVYILCLFSFHMK